MLNIVQLIGRLGKDPESRSMPNGDAVTNVSLATTESWRNKDGDKQEKTEWHNLVFFRGLAEVVSEHLKKGALIYIQGKLTTEKYEKDGEDRFITKIVVSEMKMLGGNKAEHDEHSSAAPAAKPAKGAAKSTKSDREPF
jgi:single-strand DNA-binding protein